MNNDINNTLQALVPILQMNGENVQRIEAVQDWYTIAGIEYMKEVAEITYTSGYRKYADIGCDANLTAVYDVMAVLQEIKPSSKCIGRIVRGVYEMPPIQPVASCSEIPNSSDTISRQQALEAVFSEPLYEPGLKKRDADVVVPAIYEKIKSLPPAQPESKELSEWKADFKGYINALNMPKDDYDGILEYIDEVPTAEQEAPDINVGNTDAISRTQANDALETVKTVKAENGELYIAKINAQMKLDTLPPAQPKRKKGKWIYNTPVTMKCDQCGLVIKDWDWHRFKNCPNCLADMRGEP